jgi:hypothetical protein
MNFYGLRAWVDGQLAPAGAVVEARTPAGLPCGQTTVETPGQFGLLTVYRDDPATAEVEGPRPGETISFVVDDRPATVDDERAVTWTEHGDLQRVDLVVGNVGIDLPRFYLPLVVSGDHARASPSGLQPGAPAARPAGAQTTRQISLAAGWNLISFNVLPPTSDVATVLASIAGLYSVVLGYDRGGLSYYPQLPPGMNSLRTMDPYHGYWIRMNVAATLSLSGTSVPVATPINLYAGWNLVGYLPEGPEPVTSALASIAGQYTAVTSYRGGALYYTAHGHKLRFWA